MPRKQEQEERESALQRSPLVRNVLTFLVILGIALLLWLIVTLRSVVVLILISVVFATGLAPAVSWLESIKLPGGWRLPRSVSILLIYLVGVAIVLGAITLIIVPVVRESIEFSNNLPRYLDAAKDWLASVQQRYPRLPDLPELIDKAQAQLGSAGQYALRSVGAVFGFFGSVISVITVLVITYFLLASYENIRKVFLSMIPPRYEKQADETLTDMARAMGGWLRGQLLLAGIVGGATAAAMFILGVPYATVIGVIGAIAELVPMAGPLIAAVPAVLITLFGPLWKILAVVIFFVCLSVVEGNVLGPKIMQKSVGLSPLLTVVALLAGAALLGVVGALLAIPLAASLHVLFVQVVAPALRQWEGREDGS